MASATQCLCATIVPCSKKKTRLCIPLKKILCVHGLISTEFYCTNMKPTMDDGNFFNMDSPCRYFCFVFIEGCKTGPWVCETLVFAGSWPCNPTNVLVSPKGCVGFRRIPSDDQKKTSDDQKIRRKSSDFFLRFFFWWKRV